MPLLSKIVLIIDEQIFEFLFILWLQRLELLCLILHIFFFQYLRDSNFLPFEEAVLLSVEREHITSNNKVIAFTCLSESREPRNQCFPHIIKI